MKRTLYVAVVAFMPHLDSKPDVAISRRPEGFGDYASFIGYNKAAVIKKALRVTAQWEDKAGKNPGHYTVLVGKLDNAARGTIKLTAIKQ